MEPDRARTTRGGPAGQDRSPRKRAGVRCPAAHPEPAVGIRAQRRTPDRAVLRARAANRAGFKARQLLGADHRVDHQLERLRPPIHDKTFGRPADTAPLPCGAISAGGDNTSRPTLALPQRAQAQRWSRGFVAVGIVFALVPPIRQATR